MQWDGESERWMDWEWERHWKLSENERDLILMRVFVLQNSITYELAIEE